MKLLLVRHGNTFGPDDRVVWTGGANDIPLVEKGYEQADAVAHALLRLAMIPERIVTGPLQRTACFAERIRTHIDKDALIPIEVDSCLHEIDYGPWTDCTREEVIERGDASYQDAWDTRSIWPAHIFNGNPDSIVTGIQSFVDTLYQRHPRDLILCVSSNGKLRYFLKLIDGAFERAIESQSFKVKTGNLCLLEYRARSWHQCFWNCRPEELTKEHFTCQEALIHDD